MTTGIYCLRFKGTDKVYIGQSNNIIYRFNQHIRSLKKGTSSIKLNNAYKLYGGPILKILLICSENMLNVYENILIKHYNAVENGFNTYDESRGRFGHLGIRGELNTSSIYSNKLISEAFLYIVNNPDKSIKQVSDTYSISTSTIGAITALTQHTWLKEMYPEEYTVLANRKGLNNKGYKYCAKALGIIYPPLISPSGEVFDITNISEFARKHNLAKSNLCSVLNGHRKSHKGWKLWVQPDPV